MPQSSREQYSNDAEEEVFRFGDQNPPREHPEVWVPRHDDITILPAYPEQKQSGEIILFPRSKHVSDTLPGTVKDIDNTDDEQHVGEVPELIHLSPSEISYYSAQSEGVKEKDPLADRLGMNSYGLLHKIDKDPKSVIDLLASSYHIPTYSDLCSCAESLDFSTGEFSYVHAKDVEEIQHALIDFSTRFGESCRPLIAQYLFYIAKLGRWNKNSKDNQNISNALSDEFVAYIGERLRELSYDSSDFISTYNTALLCAERYDEESAKEIVLTLQQKQKLSGDLAQYFFRKFPNLKESFDNHCDFQNVPIEELIHGKKEFGAIALNEVDTLRPIPTNVGIEIEIKLSGEDQFRLSTNPLMQTFLRPESLVELGEDGGGNIAEVRSREGGFPLSEEAIPQLFSIVRTLEKSADMSAFGTTHVSVDRRALNLDTSFIQFRKFDENRMEISEVPISLSGDTSMFDLSGYIDQMMIIGAFSDVSQYQAKHMLRDSGVDIKSNMLNLLANKQEGRLLSLLPLAREMGRDDIIPAILRSAHKKLLPGVQAVELVDACSLSDILPLLINEDIDNGVRVCIVARMQESPFTELRPILEDESIDSLVREGVASRLQETPFTELLPFLANGAVDPWIRRSAASRLRETPFTEVRSILEDDWIDSMVLEEIADRLQKIPLAEVLPFLENPDFNYEIRKIVATHLTETPFIELRPFLEDDSIYPGLRRKGATSLQETSFGELLPFLEDENISHDVREAVASRLKETPFTELLPYLMNPCLNKHIHQIVASRLEVTLFTELRIFLENRYIDNEVRKMVASRLKETPFAELRTFLEDDDIESDIRIRVAKHIQETSFGELRPFLEDENVDKLVRNSAASSLLEMSLEETRELLVNEKMNNFRGAIFPKMAKKRAHREKMTLI